MTRLQLVVLYNDNTFMYYRIPSRQGWKFESNTRQIIVGKGIPRTYIPLDTVRSYSIERISDDLSTLQGTESRRLYQLEDLSVPAQGSSSTREWNDSSGVGERNANRTSAGTDRVNVVGCEVPWCIYVEKGVATYKGQVLPWD